MGGLYGPGLSFNDGEGNPANVAGTAADGTSTYAARRDHAHVGGLVLLSQQTASDSASLNFTSVITSTYDNYLAMFSGIIPATDGASFHVRFSSDNGSNWLAGTSYSAGYSYVGVVSGSGVVQNSATSAWVIAAANKNSTAGVSGRLDLVAPLLSQYTQGVFSLNQYNSGDSNFYTYTGGAVYLATTVLNAVQFLFSSGNITSGTISLYGLTK